MDLNNKPVGPIKNDTSFDARNRYKIFGILISIILVFSIIFISFILLSIKATIQSEGIVVITLIRIAFIILGTPIVIILFFIGNRIDTAKDKTARYRYPLWVELTGMLLGLFLGLSIATLWIINLTISQSLIWANPILYIPIPIITPLITYLCFKGMQLIYALIDKKPIGTSFRWPLIIFLISSPILIYSGYIIAQISQEASYQSNVTITNFKKIQQGDKYILTADMYVPQTSLYNVTATSNSSSTNTLSGKIRINGIETIGLIHNYALHKGMNSLIYYPNSNACPYSTNRHLSVNFNIRKVLDDLVPLALPKVITKTIICH